VKRETCSLLDILNCVKGIFYILKNKSNNVICAIRAIPRVCHLSCKKSEWFFVRERERDPINGKCCCCCGSGVDL